MSQLGGGIGTRGPGETQLETDRRKINRRVRHVKQQIENVRRIRAQQRQRRESVPVATVALVGYTNAGKSTLFNALTKSNVAASSRMFATREPTIRAADLIGSGGYSGAGGVYECGKVYVVQCPHQIERSGVVAHVCHARSDHSRR